MGKHLKIFNNRTEYASATKPLPNVSVCLNDNWIGYVSEDEETREEQFQIHEEFLKSQNQDQDQKL